MGVCTTMYALNTKMMKKVKADNENLAFIVGECEEDKTWQVAKYEFDKSIEIFINILHEAGATKSAKLMDSEYADLELFEYEPYDIWSIPPSKVKTIVEELESITVESLKTDSGDSKISDRRNNILREEELESYLEEFGDIKQFLNEALIQKNYLVFTEA
jgi:hypothetical protein